MATLAFDFGGEIFENFSPGILTLKVRVCLEPIFFFFCYFLLATAFVDFFVKRSLKLKAISRESYAVDSFSFPLLFSFSFPLPLSTCFSSSHSLPPTFSDDRAF